MRRGCIVTRDRESGSGKPAPVKTSNFTTHGERLDSSPSFLGARPVAGNSEAFCEARIRWSGEMSLGRRGRLYNIVCDSGCETCDASEFNAGVAAEASDA